LNAFPEPPFSDLGPQGPLDKPAKPRRARWKGILAWTAGTVAVLLVLLGVEIYALLHSKRFHAYLLRTAQVKATQALGSQVQFRDFALGWSGWGPNAKLYGIVVQGAPPYPAPPLLKADLLSVQVTISSLWHRSWYVNDLRIKHPVVHIFADNQGRTNLPRPSSNRSSGSKLDVFSLGIRHFLLDQGEIFYNSQKSDLAADVHQLKLQFGFAPLTEKYSGTLFYRDGHLQWQGSNPLPHQLDARFTLTPQQFTLESAVLKTQRSRVSLEATARNYSRPKVHAVYDAVVDGSEFQRALKSKSVPGGLVYLSGVVDYQNQPGREPLDSTNLQGELHSAALTVAQQGTTIKVRDIRAEYSLKNGDARVSGIRAELLGGSLEASLTMRNLTGPTRSTLDASLKNLAASAIQESMGPAALDRAVMRGSVNASANAAWGKTFRDLVAKADVKIAASMQPAHGGTSTPVNGLIHARYDAPKEILALGKSYLRTPQTSISLEGTVSDRSLLQITVDAGQLHELEGLADAFTSSKSAPLDVYGSAMMAATVSGSRRNLQVRGSLTARNLRLRSTAWNVLRAQFSASPSSVRVDGGQLTSANKGKITFQLAADLNRWAFTNASGFQVRAAASDLRAEELAKAAGIGEQISGTLSAKVEAHGTELAPVGQGEIQLNNASLAGEPVKQVKAGFQGNGNTLGATLQVDLKAGSATADLQYEPRQRAYEATLRAVGIKLDQLEVVKARNLQLTGVLNMTASGHGTLQDPGLQTTVEIPRLGIRNLAINDLKLTGNVAHHVAAFDLTSKLLGAEAGGHGTIQMTGDYPADIKVDTPALPLQAVIAIAAPAQAANLTGETELHATVHAPLKNTSQLQAHLKIPQFTLNYKNTLHWRAAAPIQADYTNGILDVKRSAIRGTGTDLTFQASIPAAKDAPSSMLLRGTIDLQLAELLNPEITSRGQLRFDIDSYGRRSDPDLQGQIRIVNASFTQAGTPLGLSDGNGVLTLTRDRLEVTQFEAKAGGGTVTASGGVVYRPKLSLNVAMKANDVRLIYAQSIRATLGSNLALTGQYDNALLRGEVNIEDLSFTSNFDLMETAGQFSAGVAPPPPTGGFEDNLRLQVAVHTSGSISPSSRNLSVTGSANLQLRGTASEPVILGRINLRDGELIFRGNRYLVQAGTIEFRNPSRTEPVLSVRADTTIDQYDIHLRVWGPADHLHTNYSSDPALPSADVINLIAFGKTSEAAAAQPTSAGLGAESLIASQVSSQVTGRIEKLAGISQLSVDPVLGSGQQNAGARIAIQQRVTSKIFVTYSTDVTSTGQQAAKLEYQVNRKASLIAVRNQNGGFSFETNFRKQW
jgi:translocation and assembly module TamB